MASHMHFTYRRMTRPFRIPGRKRWLTLVGVIDSVYLDGYYSTTLSIVEVRNIVLACLSLKQARPRVFPS